MTTIPEEQAVAQGRGKWSQPGVPHRGWSCIEIEDLEDSRRTCEMCESQEVRYAHHMSHPQFSDVLVVGCVCAGNMEGDLARARQRDRQMANRSVRRRRWLTRQWRRSAKGNEWLNADGFRVTVYQKRGAWAATVASEEDDSFVRHSQRRYPTRDAAKLAAFDVITRLATDRS